MKLLVLGCFFILQPCLLNATDSTKIKVISYNQNPNDSILQAFLSKKRFDSLRKSKEGFSDTSISFSRFKAINKLSIKSLIDSLDRNTIQYRSMQFEFECDTALTNRYRKQKKIPNNDFNFFQWSYYFHGLGYGYGNESPYEEGLYVFYLGRTIGDKKNKRDIEFIIIEVPPPIALFAPDWIGHYKKDFNFNRVDSFIRNITTYDTVDISHKLTKPFNNELEKVKAIFDWITKFISYDFEGLRSGNMIHKYSDVLKYRRGVCAGYADLFYQLCVRSKIECGYVGGETPEGRHAWNIVKINNKWYLIDVTWGQNYFLMDPTVFIKDHIPDIWAYSLLPKREDAKKLVAEMKKSK